MSKKTRVEQMEELLHYLQQLYLSNPDKKINSNDIYRIISKYKLNQPEELYLDSNINIRRCFEQWTMDYINNPNLKAFCNPNQPNFLTFTNLNDINDQCYKLYVSFPEEHLYSCVNEIFKFIAQNNIKTVSKVADRIRTDSVVIRLTNEKDAIRVINHINGTESIRKHCNPVNPFLITMDNVGLGYGAWLSYNSLLSFLLEKYFNSKIFTNTIKETSLKDFAGFINTLYHNLLTNPIFLNYFLEEPYINGEINRLKRNNNITTEEILSSIKNNLELIRTSITPEKDSRDYFDRLKKFTNPNHETENIRHFQKMLLPSPSKKHL